MDALKYAPKGKSSFLRKEDLEASGPRVLTIVQVTVGEGFPDRDTGVRGKELQLVFTDGLKTGLGGREVFNQVVALLGRDTAKWVGHDVEAFVDPDVRGPKGRGGIRFRAPGGPAPLDEPFVSDLEDGSVPPPRTPTVLHTVPDGDDIPF
jgi:hypothetical protein